MNSDQNKNADNDEYRAEQLLMHALLTGIHENTAAREQRISATLQRFEETLVRVEPPTEPKRWKRSLRWLVMIAAVLVAGFFWNQFLQPTHLSAAVDRVQMAATEPVTRIYDLRLVAELRDGMVFSRRGRLHTKSTSQFVAMMGDSKRPLIFGSDGENEWFVMGNRSGYLGDAMDNVPDPPVIEERMHRFMLANQFLQSLSDRYQVTLVDEPTPPRIDRPCTVLLGRRSEGRGFEDRRWPNEVRIWADQESGVALRVRLIWHRPSRRRPQEVVMDFVGERPVADDFYSLEHHVVADAN